jgi:hypothetical protein
MMRTYIFILIQLLFISTIRSQAKLDFKAVDELTGKYFKEQKWDSIIRVGNNALRQNIDYYYLRVRMGISYFEKQKYLPAAFSLEKARSLNSGDSLITYYLYRSYIYSNHDDEARLVRDKIPKDNRDTKSTGNGFLEQAHLEGGYTLSNDRSSVSIPDLTGTFKAKSDNDYYSEQDLYGNTWYGNLELKMRIFKRLSLSLSYNYLSLDKSTYIMDGHFQDRFMGTSDSGGVKRIYHYSYPWVTRDTSFHYRITQHEGHLGINVALPAGFKIQPAIHLIYVAYTMTNLNFRANTINDTSSYSYSSKKYTYHPFTHYNYAFFQKDTSFYNYVISLLVTKDIKIFNIGLSLSWSNLNNLTQEQAGLMLTYYPLGNLDFYGTTAATGFLQGNESRILLSQVLGTKVTRWWWLEGNFYWGNYSNTNIFNGAVVYNNSDKIDYHAGASLIFIAGKHIQLSLIYQYLSEESPLLYDIKRPSPGQGPLKINEQPQITYIPYNTNNIIGGITWKL